MENNHSDDLAYHKTSLDYTRQKLYFLHQYHEYTKYVHVLVYIYSIILSIARRTNEI